VSNSTTTQCLLFPNIFRKPTYLRFDQRQSSSDGGAVLLKAADRRYGLTEALAGCLRDKRQAGKVDHSLHELLAQRVFAIACGYPDANDSARLASDPIHKMLLDRDPPPVAIWPLNPPCHALRTRWEQSNFMRWRRCWPCA
jgi:Transposase DDE domain group 1